MNALVPTTMPLQDMQTLAVAIAKSALFGIRTPEQALVLMAIAQAEGRHPVEAARDYDIINNRPAKKAEAMLRDFIQAGGKVQWHSLTDELADATFTHPQTGEVRIDWDMKRAQTAFGKKDMYAKFPRQMLRSRVVSEGVRTLWPLATSGMLELGEASAIQPEHNGPTLEATPEREAINDAVPLKPAAASTPRAGRKVDPTVYDAPLPRMAEEKPLPDYTDAQWDNWIGKLRSAAAVVSRRQELVEMAHPKRMVGKALAEGPDWVKRDIDAILHDNYARFPAEDEPTEEELGEVEIEGESKVMAG
jgi:hypothetical protein